MKKLLILSGKGGTGKTTVASAIIKLAKAGAVADCDVDAPNLHLVLSQKTDPAVTEFLGGDKAWIDAEKCSNCGLCKENCRFGALIELNGTMQVKEYSCEGCGVCEAVCPEGAVSLHTDVAGKKELYQAERVFSTAVLKMGRGNSGKLVSEVKSAMLKNAPDTQLAVIDGSPGIGCPVMAAVSGVDFVLIVAEPSYSGLSDLKRLLSVAEGFQTKAAVCVNKWNISPENTERVEDFCKEAGIPFVGRIPYDPTAVAAANNGQTLADQNNILKTAVQDIYCQVMELLGISCK